MRERGALLCSPPKPPTERAAHKAATLLEREGRFTFEGACALETPREGKKANSCQAFAASE